jgi:C4-dicarboxylate-specific signal transduction histidine kinase
LKQLDQNSILENHVAGIKCDFRGKITWFSSSAKNQLKNLSSGKSLKEYFPKLDLSEGLQDLKAQNAYMLKNARVQVIKEEDGSFSVYFSHDFSKSKAEYEHQMHIAELAVLGEMTAGIAHEISNPLTIISGFASHIKNTLERESIESPAISKKSQRIVDTVKRVEHIVSAMRKLARGTKDEDPLITIEIQDILKEALVLTTYKLSSNNVALDIGEYDKSLSIDCQPIQISQVLINLINNASDALENVENPQVKLDIFEKNGDVVILVKDSAGSLKKELYDRIFEQNVTTKKLGKGSGIGLYLSKKITTAHKGSLRAYVDNGWTIFEFRIPKSKQQNGVNAA